MRSERTTKTVLAFKVMLFLAFFTLFGNSTYSVMATSWTDQNQVNASNSKILQLKYVIDIKRGDANGFHERGPLYLTLRGMLNSNNAISKNAIFELGGSGGGGSELSDIRRLVAPTIELRVGSESGYVRVIAPKGTSTKYEGTILVPNRGNSKRFEFVAPPTDTECTGLKNILPFVFDFINDNYGDLETEYWKNENGGKTRTRLVVEFDENEYHRNMSKFADCKPGPAESISSGGGSSDGSGSGVGNNSSNNSEVSSRTQIVRTPRDNTCVSTAILGDGNESCDDSGDGTGPIGNVIDTVATVASFGVGIVGMIGITVSGIQYLTAAGDEEKVRKSKRRMAEIVIGVAAYVLIYSLINWLSP